MSDAVIGTCLYCGKTLDSRGNCTGAYWNKARADQTLDDLGPAIWRDRPDVDVLRAERDAADMAVVRMTEANAALRSENERLAIGFDHMRATLVTIGLMCASGYYGRDNHEYATEAKLLARHALDEIAALEGKP